MKYKIIHEIREMISENISKGIVGDKFSMLNDSRDNPVQELIRESRRYLESDLAIKCNESENLVSEITGKFLKTAVKAKLNKKAYKGQKWKEELIRLLITKSNLTSIALLKDFFSILSVFAEIVCSIVKMEDKVLELLAIVKKNVTQSVVLPELIQKLNRMIDAFNTNEAYRLKELLKNILDTTESDPKSLIDVTEQLLMVQSKLQRIDRLYAINSLRGDMLEVL